MFKLKITSFFSIIFILSLSLAQPLSPLVAPYPVTIGCSNGEVARTGTKNFNTKADVEAYIHGLEAHFGPFIHCSVSDTAGGIGEDFFDTRYSLRPLQLLRMPKSLFIFFADLNFNPAYRLLSAADWDRFEVAWA